MTGHIPIDPRLTIIETRLTIDVEFDGHLFARFFRSRHYHGDFPSMDSVRRWCADLTLPAPIDRTVVDLQDWRAAKAADEAIERLETWRRYAEATLLPPLGENVLFFQTEHHQDDLLAEFIDEID